MSIDHQSAIMNRIAAAVARLEAASQQIAASTAPAPAIGQADAAALNDLQARHAKLRSETSAALQALETVIQRAQTVGEN